MKMMNSMWRPPQQPQAPQQGWHPQQQGQGVGPHQGWIQQGFGPHQGWGQQSHPLLMQWLQHYRSQRGGQVGQPDDPRPGPWNPNRY